MADKKHVFSFMSVAIGTGVPILAGVFAVYFAGGSFSATVMGKLSVLWMVSTFASNFDFGLGRLLGRHVAREFGSAEALEQAYAVAFYLLGAMGLVFGLILAGVLYLYWSALSGLSSVLLPATLSIVLIGSAQRYILEAKGGFSLSALSSGLSGLVTYVIPVLCLYIGFDFDFSVFLFLSIRLSIGLMLYLLSGGGVSLSRLAELPSMVSNVLSDGKSAIGYSVSCLVSAQFDRVLASHFLPLPILYLYNLPMDLMQRVAVFPAMAMRVLNPHLDRAIAKGGVDGHTLRNIYLAGLFLLVCSFLVTFLVGDLLRLWFSRSFSNIAIQVAIAGLLSAGLSGLNYGTTGLAVASGRQSQLLKFHAIFTAVVALCSIPVVAMYGIYGLAMAVLVRSAGELLGVHFLVLRSRERKA